MGHEPRLSPYLGGPGARWAQAVLFLLHLALEVSLVFLGVAFLRIQARLPIEGWHRGLFGAILGFSLVAFGWRAARIGRDLWTAWRSRPGRGSSGGPGEDI